MSITGYSQKRIRDMTEVTVVSDLSGADVFFHWYVDGAYVGMTREPSKTFALAVGDQVRITAVDTTDADFDPVASAPEGWPARRSIFWIRSMSADVERYRVEQRQDAGEWVTVGEVRHSDQRWSYQLVTGRLVDLADYEFRVVPVDLAGNDGTALALESMKVVRTPDAPEFTITFNAGPDTVTFGDLVEGEPFSIGGDPVSIGGEELAA